MALLLIDSNNEIYLGINEKAGRVIENFLQNANNRRRIDD